MGDNKYLIKHILDNINLINDRNVLEEILAMLGLEFKCSFKKFINLAFSEFKTSIREFDETISDIAKYKNAMDSYYDLLNDLIDYMTDKNKETYDTLMGLYNRTVIGESNIHGSCNTRMCKEKLYIKKDYTEWARTNHPDKHRENDPIKHQEILDRFQSVQICVGQNIYCTGHVVKLHFLDQVIPIVSQNNLMYNKLDNLRKKCK